jgi:DNA helicase HerA-like ATPase
MRENDEFIGSVIDGVVIGDRHTPSPRYVWVLSKRGDIVLGDFVKIVDKMHNIEFIGYVSEILPKSEYSLPTSVTSDSVEQRMGAIDVALYLKEPILFLKVTILKVHDKGNGALIEPIKPIMIGLPVYSLDDDLAQKALGLGLSPKSMHIGSLYNKQSVPVYLNSQFVVNHIGIWGMQGSGKSETATVLIEELTKLDWAVVLFDLHGEYSDIDKPKRAGDQGLKVKRLILGDKPEGEPGESLKLELPCMLEQPDKAIELLIDAAKYADVKNPLSEQGLDLLKALYKSVVLGENIGKNRVVSPPENWGKSRCPHDPQVFFEGLRDKADEVGNKLEYSHHTIDAVKRRLRLINDPGLWGGRLIIKDVVLPGYVTLIDLSKYMPKTLIDEEFDIPVRIIFAVFLKRLLEAKKLTHEISVDLPVAVVVDEAGEFFPPEDSFLSNLGASFIRQVRKLNVGMIVIAQSPGYIHPDIIGQIKTHIMFRLTGKALEETKKYVGAEPEVFEDLMSLSNMTAYIYGDMTENIPIKVKVREPRVRHKKFLGMFE